MARRVTREYVDEGADDVVVEDRRPMFLNPVSTIVGLLLIVLLLWAVFWGPIGEMFDGDGEGPNVNVDTPNVNTNTGDGN